MNNNYNDILSQFFIQTNGIRQMGNYYVYKENEFYGVAIDNLYNVKIEEVFSNVQIKTLELASPEKSLIVLTSTLLSHKKEFASFCAQFVEEGPNSSIRLSIQKNPLVWWKKWTELIGNKLSNKKPYDIIAELLVLEKLYHMGYAELQWNGPIGSSVDISAKNDLFEVKSTIVKYDNQVSISSHFQLDDVENEDLHLVFVRLEESDKGNSINDITERLRVTTTIDVDDIEKKLYNKGFKTNNSVRDAKYNTLEIRKYLVDDDFPKITKESFINSKIPDNIKKITYIVSLDGIEFVNWE